MVAVTRRRRKLLEETVSPAHPEPSAEEEWTQMETDGQNKITRSPRNVVGVVSGGGLLFIVYISLMLYFGSNVKESDPSLPFTTVQEPSAQPPKAKRPLLGGDGPLVANLWYEKFTASSAAVKSQLQADRVEERETISKSLLPAKAYRTGFTSNPNLSKGHVQLMMLFSRRVHRQDAKLFSARAAAVPWGGRMPWWDHGGRTFHSSSDDPLDAIDGGYVLWSYYRIMQSHMKDPQDLDHVLFPLRMCKGSGCTAETAIYHTLEWREKYQPWKVPTSVLKENQEGWVYTRGLARPELSGHHNRKSYGRHAMLWIRPGLHKAIDPLAYFRCILHSVDLAVAESLQHSHGRVGKFNVIVDTSGYQWGYIPSISYVAQAVTMLQDHFPDRLGVVMLVNLSKIAEIFVNIVKPLFTREVREKIHVLSHDPDRQLDQLQAMVELESIPEWLGGKDPFRFDAETYYHKRIRISEQDSQKFLKTMPYHAK